MELIDGRLRAERSPFPGLDPFTASDDDAAVFAGRDAEAELVTANLRAAPLTILYGPSGVGKSSLLRAGVVHRLRRPPRRGRPARVPPPTVIVHDEWAGDAGEALARSVMAALADGAGDGLAALDVALERWSAERRGQLLIILDQFEEYLRLHGEADGDSFDRLFPYVAGRDDLPVHFLISLRDDALAELDRYQGRMPGLFDNYLRVAHMDEASARVAVLEPIACVNAWRVEAGLAGRGRGRADRRGLRGSHRPHAAVGAARRRRRGRGPGPDRARIPSARHAPAVGGGRRGRRAGAATRDAARAWRHGRDRGRPSRPPDGFADEGAARHGGRDVRLPRHPLGGEDPLHGPGPRRLRPAAGGGGRRRARCAEPAGAADHPSRPSAVRRPAVPRL